MIKEECGVRRKIVSYELMGFLSSAKTKVDICLFFLTSNGYSITEIWVGLGNQTGLEQQQKIKKIMKSTSIPS